MAQRFLNEGQGRPRPTAQLTNAGEVERSHHQIERLPKLPRDVVGFGQVGLGRVVLLEFGVGARKVGQHAQRQLGSVE